MDISYRYQNNIIKERSELVGRSDHSHKDLLATGTAVGTNVLASS